MSKKSDAALDAILKLGPRNSATSTFLQKCARELDQLRQNGSLDDDDHPALINAIDVFEDLADGLEQLAESKPAKTATAAKTKKSAKAKEKDPPPITEPSWENTPHDRVTVYVDGACRGNPGKAAAGISFQTPDGDVFFEIAETYSDKITNNVSEYRTLIKALKAAAEQGVKEITIYSDSELVVKQISGEYRIKNPDLAALAARVQQLRRKFDAFVLKAVPRAQNKRADALANYALDNE
jgi:ribonuclease HI